MLVLPSIGMGIHDYQALTHVTKILDRELSTIQAVLVDPQRVRIVGGWPYVVESGRWKGTLATRQFSPTDIFDPSKILKITDCLLRFRFAALVYQEWCGYVRSFPRNDK